MTITGLDSFDSTVQKSHIWLNEIMQEGGWEDKHRAYIILRSVLHALRDRLRVDEAVNLGAQLPMLLRGMYYDGWDPARAPLKVRSKDEFLMLIKSGYQSAQLDVEPGEAFKIVINILLKNISQGEMQEVKHSMPAQIQQLWPETTVH